MAEPTAFEILIEYVEEKGYPFETHKSERRFCLSSHDPMLNKKLIVFKIDELIFCAYDSYAAKASSSNTFTGLYSTIDTDKDLECKIHNRDWLDFIIIRHKKKTGVKFIDDHFTISSRYNWSFEKWFDEEIAGLFLQLSRTIRPIELLVQNDYLPMITELNGKKVLGLETNQWLYKKEEVDVFLNSGGELITFLKRNLSQQRHFINLR